ncbi:ABC transporter permease [Candidatus Neomarinimicrobiota bacterium]
MRTWLNVFVTAISFILLILMTGMYQGMDAHARQVTIESEIAGGAYWHPIYDPTDPFTLEDAHGVPPQPVVDLVNTGAAMPVLVSQASIYPNGRIMPVMMKGVEPRQTIVDMPAASLLAYEGESIPVLIGSGMARRANVKVGDTFTIRWLDANRTYDADEGIVVSIFKTENFKIDFGQIWIPLERAQTMLNMAGEATYVSYAQGLEPLSDTDGWLHRDVGYLTSDMTALIEAKKPGSYILFTILIALAAMGIFNSQVLTIFRRHKEIGTLMALGMTRSKVVGLFTAEGGMNAFFALIMSVVLGGPLFYWTATSGIPMPDYSTSGLMIAQRLIPVYPFALFVSTTALVSIIVTVVSYLPSRRIAKMKPTEALRGKVA